MNRLVPFLLGLALLCCLPRAVPAGEVRATVRSVSSDVLYLDKGSRDGLMPGLTGRWQSPDGQLVQVELLFTASNKASASLAGGGSGIKPGDTILFVVDEVQPESDRSRTDVDSLAIPEQRQTARPETADLPDMFSSPARQLIWWRTSVQRRTPPKLEQQDRARMSLGARGSLLPFADLDYRLQARHARMPEETRSELDEAVIVTRFASGTLAIGRFTGAGRAFPRPLDGFSWAMGAPRARLELAAGLSRPVFAERQPGAGLSAELNPFEQRISLQASLFHLRSDGLNTTGIRWQHRIHHLPAGLQLVQWIRTERSSGVESPGPQPWQTGSRLRWSHSTWSAHLQHRGTGWLETDQADSLAETPPARQRFEIGLSRHAGPLQASLRLEGRAGQRSSMESMLGADVSLRFSRQRLRVHSDHQLGPVVAGSSQGLNWESRSRSGVLWLHSDWRRWQWEDSTQDQRGWSAGFGIGGRLAGGIRAELGADWRREEGAWTPTYRLSLSGRSQ